jgi:uncharacterized protein (TIGR02588 family)
VSGPALFSRHARNRRPAEAIVVRNDSDATAAQVEVRGVLRTRGGTDEERRASFAYVPGSGEVRGGLVFQQDPRRDELELTVEGFAAP